MLSARSSRVSGGLSGTAPPGHRSSPAPPLPGTAPPQHRIVHRRAGALPATRAGTYRLGMPSPARSPGPSGSRRGAAIAPRAVYTRAQLLRLGVSERRLASNEFSRVLPGCHTLTSDPAPLLAVARAAQTWVVPGAALSHISAAEVLGLPLPYRLTWAEGAPLHVDLDPSRRRSGGVRLVTHARQSRRRITLPNRLVIADPVDVLLDLAGLLPHDDLVACIDALGSLRRRDIRVPVESVRIAAQGRRGRYVRSLRRAAQEARDAVDSPRETSTRLLLLRRGFPEPETNRPVADPATGVQYFLDLSYPHWRIAIEYDGKDHFDPVRARRDRHKDEVLHDQGWSVLRITSHDHRDPRNFLARLRAKIHDAPRRAA